MQTVVQITHIKKNAMIASFPCKLLRTNNIEVSTKKWWSIKRRQV